MDKPFYLSVIAIAISGISLLWSIFWPIYRDRVKFKVYSKLYRYNGNPIMKIIAVNYGRRSINLTMLISVYSNRHWEGHYLDETSKTYRLNEKERYELEIKPGDNYTISMEGDEVIDFYFEDTLGKRYKVRNAKKKLREFWSYS